MSRRLTEFREEYQRAISLEATFSKDAENVLSEWKESDVKRREMNRSGVTMVVIENRKEAARRIKSAKERRDHLLDLRNLFLTSLPNIFHELPDLTNLALTGNDLYLLPSTIYEPNLHYKPLQIYFGKNEVSATKEEAAALESRVFSLLQSYKKEDLERCKNFLFAQVLGSIKGLNREHEMDFLSEMSKMLRPLMTVLNYDTALLKKRQTIFCEESYYEHIKRRNDVSEAKDVTTSYHIIRNREELYCALLEESYKKSNLILHLHGSHESDGKSYIVTRGEEEGEKVGIRIFGLSNFAAFLGYKSIEFFSCEIGARLGNVARMKIRKRDFPVMINAGKYSVGASDSIRVSALELADESKSYLKVLSADFGDALSTFVARTLYYPEIGYFYCCDQVRGDVVFFKKNIFKPEPGEAVTDKNIEDHLINTLGRFFNFCQYSSLFVDLVDKKELAKSLFTKELKKNPDLIESYRKNAIQIDCSRGRKKFLAEYLREHDTYDVYHEDDGGSFSLISLACGSQLIRANYSVSRKGRFLFEDRLKEEDARIAKINDDTTYDIVHLLLSRGADIHRDENKALCSACARGKIKTVKLLLERGVDVNPSEEHIPLEKACKGGCKNTTELLLKHGSYINFELDDYGEEINKMMRLYLKIQKEFMVKAERIHSNPLHLLLLYENFARTSFVDGTEGIDDKYLNDYLAKFEQEDTLKKCIFDYNSRRISKPVHVMSSAAGAGAGAPSPNVVASNKKKVIDYEKYL